MNDIENRDDIERLLRRFYSLAIDDDLIGHHFDSLDLKNHIPVITDFWDKTLFGSEVYFGNPLAVHKQINDKTPISREDFDRWVELFRETVDSRFEGEKADAAKERAGIVADSLFLRLSSEEHSIFLQIEKRGRES